MATLFHKFVFLIDFIGTTSTMYAVTTKRDPKLNLEQKLKKEKARKSMHTLKFKIKTPS